MNDMEPAKITVGRMISGETNYENGSLGEFNATKRSVVIAIWPLASVLAKPQEALQEALVVEDESAPVSSVRVLLSQTEAILLIEQLMKQLDQIKEGTEKTNVNTG